MNSKMYETFDQYFKYLKLDYTAQEIAIIASENNFSHDQLEALNITLATMVEKKKATTVATLLKLSRLPQNHQKTFDNFNFDVLKCKNIEEITKLRELNSIYSNRNLAFIGPAGTGKTHLAQAYGYECCKNGLKTYFVKMSEIRDKFTTARRNGKEATAINSLVRPACLIIDEVGHCDFDRVNTKMFFDMIDRRYHKAGISNTVFTSNSDPSLWHTNFNDDDAMLCSLDRIFDRATVFTFRGESYRGKQLQKVAINTVRVNVSK